MTFAKYDNEGNYKQKKWYNGMRRRIIETHSSQVFDFGATWRGND